MTLLNHLGVLLLLLLVFNLKEAFGEIWDYRDWYDPSGEATILFVIFEAFYWVMYICFF